MEPSSNIKTREHSGHIDLSETISGIWVISNIQKLLKFQCLFL